MKNILVPTDFSRNANHAAKYALDIASEVGADITLFNVYSFPVLISEAPVQPFTDEEIEEASVRQLRQLATRLKKYNTKGVTIKIASEFGAPEEEILNKARRSRADMIVMGAKGETGFLNGLFGNVTTGVCRNATIPVMAVPAYARYEGIDNVMVACDRTASLTDPILNVLKSISSTFHAKLSLIRSAHIGEYLTWGGELTQKQELDKKLGNALDKIGIDIMAEAVDGIIHAANKLHADLIVLISHKHDLVGRIFHGTTRRVIRQSKKPVLVLPQKIREVQVKRIFKETANA